MATKTASKFRLKDPKTGFFDPETRLKVVGDDEVTIDPKAKKGKLTLAAINAGGLIEVGSEAGKAPKDDKSEGAKS